MSYNGIIGHQRHIDRLKLSRERFRLANGYLFTGAEGVGKSLIAREFAKSFFCKTDPCDVCNDCKKILNNVHGNVKVVNPNEETITIEQSREISRFFSLKSDSYRFILINDAHLMTEEAQNALLKILEEPPAKSSIILITHSSGSLLETVISRCQIFNFSHLSKNSVIDIIGRDFKLEQEDLEIVYFLSGGGLGKSREIASSFDQVKGQIKLILEKLQAKDFNYLVETFGKGKTTDESREKARFLFSVLMQNGMEQLSRDDVSVLEAVFEGQKALDQNANVTLVIEGTLTK